jgi:signal transduction histidine kinase/ligand-binding sensor domain-containing protein
VSEKAKIKSKKAKICLVITSFLLIFFLSVSSQNNLTNQAQKTPASQTTPLKKNDLKDKDAETNKENQEVFTAEDVQERFTKMFESQNLNIHKWGAITLFNGLPSDNVFAIAQTSDGILWFGTESGLTRFDGRRAQTISLENATSNKIRSLEVAEDGSLWVGTEKGAFRLKDGKTQSVPIPNPNPDPNNPNEDLIITAILLAENAYLATKKGMILKVSENENSFQTEQVLSNPLTNKDGKSLNITSLAKVDGKIIAGSQGRGVLILENNQAREIRSHPISVNHLAQDKDGKIWLGAYAGKSKSGFFTLIDLKFTLNFGAGLGDVSAIEPIGDGEVWVGTKKNGLYRFREGQELEHFTLANTNRGLVSDSINALLLDREGVLWIGTDRGVCRYDAASPFNQTLSDKSNPNYIRTLFRSSAGRIFAGTNSGLFLFDGKNWNETGNFSNRAIYVLGENSNKQLLIGTPKGLFDFNGNNILNGDIRAISNLNDKTYLAVFGRGLVEGENTIFSNNSMLSLLPDGEKLWLGALNGVFFYDGKEIRQDAALEGLRGKAVRKIIKGIDQDLWFATGAGLFLYRNGKLQEIIKERDLRDVVIIGTEVWAASEIDGIFHARQDELFDWVVTNLNREQGLSSQKTSTLLNIENRLLIGTSRSLVSYVPSKIPPKIVATRVLSQRLHESAELTGVIPLEYPQNSLLVEVAGLSSRTFPEQFQYGFLLKNAKGEILDQRISIDSQFAPTDLKAGEYSIEVRAFNKDLLASEPLTIRFSVARAPFPWTATALGILLVIALAGLIWAMIERRRIVQKNRELAAAKFDLTNEAERERKRIARDLHDQTLADLRNLMLKSDKLPGETAEFRGEIESVSTEIRRICEDLSPSVLENVGLIAALEFLLQQTVENYKFSAPEDLDEKLNFSPNVQMQIYRIAQEVLTNIKHHSDAKSVEMKVEISDENKFMLKISDDGTPFNPIDAVHKGRGIANIKNRAALIEAEVDWIPTETVGTEFWLKLWTSTVTKPQ